MAHVDHGKSTLADRFLELTKTVDPRKMQSQYLDSMELERERGITIKMAPVRMDYTLNAIRYTLNLIDTPGHSDFSYEVSRALAAVEGAILLVDATQGIQAQTIANYNIGKKLGLAIIPAINKVDLNPYVEDIERDIVNLLGCAPEDIYKISGKTGQGVEKLLKAVIEKVPPPKNITSNVAGHVHASRALIFDSKYDSHKGIIAFVRVFEGSFKKGDNLWLCAMKSKAEAFEPGYFAPALKPQETIGAGEIGYLALGIKDTSLVRIGDTITLEKGKETVAALPGYREPQPVVFASFYTHGADEFDILKNAVEKLHLTDSSFSYEPEASEALGRGYRLGFLGTLHLEIIAERIKREFDLDVITTLPSVAYMVTLKNGEEKKIFKPQDFPEENYIALIKEPMIKIDIISRQQDYGAIMEVAGGYRMIYEDVDYFGSSVFVKFKMPLAELLGDFHDKLKSVTSGYASVNYELIGYEEADVVKMDIMLAGDEISEFSRIVPKIKLDRESRAFVGQLKEVLPRETFAIAIQAKVGGKIIARENIPALRKDVTGYLYGGDRSRKMKLWKKQQRGKKKMLERAHVDIPSDVYIKILRGDKGNQ